MSPQYAERYKLLLCRSMPSSDPCDHRTGLKRSRHPRQGLDQPGKPQRIGHGADDVERGPGNVVLHAFHIAVNGFLIDAEKPQETGRKAVASGLV